MSKKTILLVEDDPIYAGFVQAAIAQRGLPYNVLHVSTIDSALAYIQGEPPYHDRATHPMPAIVLLDLNLSSASGFPVLRWLQEHGDLKDEKVRVVILTASDHPKDTGEALQFGALSYLVKSPSSESIITLLHKFVVSPS